MLIIKTPHCVYLSEPLLHREGEYLPVHFVFEDGTEIIETRTKNIFNRNGRLPKRTRDRIMADHLFVVGTIPYSVEYYEEYVKVSVRYNR